VLFLICVDFTSYFMRTNPGGGLAPEDVVGRDALIADLWDKLERHSVMMTAERRMGKTSVLRKMLAQRGNSILLGLGEYPIARSSGAGDFQ
jgi:hypothetical protein